MRKIVAALVAFLLCATSTLSAQERRFDAGVRAGVDAANGEPANDIPSIGVLAHYALTDRWTLVLALDRAEFDFEQPAKLLGVAQDPAVEPIDALAEATNVTVAIERILASGASPTSFFVGAGVGAAFVDVPDAAGLRADGGSFAIETQADTEVVLSAHGGVRRRIGERWYGEFALRAAHHFADWRMIDRVSGAQGAINDYATWGAYLAVGVSW